MPKAKRLSKKWTVGQEAKLQEQLWNTEHIHQQAGKGFIYFITLRKISQGEHTEIINAYFVDFFMFLWAKLSTSFLISLSMTD